jgi:hypothetical protein
MEQYHTNAMQGVGSVVDMGVTIQLVFIGNKIKQNVMKFCHKSFYEFYFKLSRYKNISLCI